jgi:hypothetical protein
MSQNEINNTLNEHGIETKTIGGDLMVLDVWKENEEVFKMWVNAPNTLARLKEFLNY